MKNVTYLILYDIYSIRIEKNNTQPFEDELFLKPILGDNKRLRIYNGTSAKVKIKSMATTE